MGNKPPKLTGGITLTANLLDVVENHLASQEVKAVVDKALGRDAKANKQKR